VPSSAAGVGPEGVCGAERPAAYILCPAPLGAPAAQAAWRRTSTGPLPQDLLWTQDVIGNTFQSSPPVLTFNDVAFGVASMALQRVERHVLACEGVPAPSRFLPAGLRGVGALLVVLQRREGRDAEASSLGGDHSVLTVLTVSEVQG
jgi:hypothetical protein